MIFVKLAFVIIFLALGVIGCKQAISGYFQMRAAQSWSVVSGTITSVTLKKNPAKQKRPSTAARYLTYSYSVQHKTYQGEREYFGVQMARHNESAGGYEEGKVVDIYYNPAMPSSSVLKRDSYRGVILPLLFSIIFLIVAGYLGFQLRR